MTSRNNWHTSKREPRPPAYWRARAIVLKAAKYLCAIRLEGICTGKATQTDHIIPVSEGGTDAAENLRAACEDCNTELNYRNRPKPPPRTLKRKPEAHPGRIN